MVYPKSRLNYLLRGRRENVLSLSVEVICTVHVSMILHAEEEMRIRLVRIVLVKCFSI